MPFVATFDSQLSLDPAFVGGKGANLGRLTQAGFDVPSGFTITTAAYRDAVEAAGLWPRIAGLLDQIDHGNPGRLDEICSRIRSAIVEASLPEELAEQVGEAYVKLGSDLHVAVRSSGTAEDLAGASFAGLHDTFLDVRGVDALLEHVKRCWASMWTSRAVAYRFNNGFDHATASLAVVVQEMISSEVSGVLFTGNPVTAATDEIVINGSWGLGEGIVSGILTPDQWVVMHGDLEIVEETIGAKERRVVRNPSTGVGTVTEDVAPSDRQRLCLESEQITELANLGRRVHDYYGLIPQDVEWAFAKGRFVLLQSRPVTGVEFAWDAEVDGWRDDPGARGTIWSRSMADELWTGAISPLFYSIRGLCWQRGHEHLCRSFGMDDAAVLPLYRFHQAEAYVNCAAQRKMVEGAPPESRASMLAHLPPDWREPAAAASFDKLRYARHYATVQLAHPEQGLYRWFKNMDHWIHERFEEASGLADGDLRRLSDAELQRYVDRLVELEVDYHIEFWIPFWIYARDVLGQLADLVGRWYDGDNPAILMDLLTGVPGRTITGDENHQLWLLTQEIRNSAELRAHFEANPGASFFTRLDEIEDGRAFKVRYAEFQATSGHRGHTDRDFYYPRRSEDPGVDYQIFQALLTTGGDDPAIRETEVNQRRVDATEEVLANVRRRPLGAVKAEVLKGLLDYALKFLMVRDDERYIVDRSTFTMKLACLEIGRRLVERGLLDTAMDVHFLAQQDLYGLLQGNVARLELVQAKIGGRKRDFERFVRRETSLPTYLRDGRPLDLDTPVEGALSGVGTSRGKITGTARVVHGLHEIGRVRAGDILVCNATDPAWTPVFMAIKGLVLETGGMLAHGSLLSREYGIPAVQLANAVRIIADGATITVDGDSGLVVVDEEAPSEVDEDELSVGAGIAR